MERLQILWVARSYTLPESGVKPHYHPYYHMFYVVKGICQYTAAGVTSQLEPGDCLLVPSQTEHSYLNPGGITLEYLEIKFVLAPSPMDNQLQNAGVTVSQNPLAGALFEQIIQEYSDLGNLADSAAADYLSALLCALTQSMRYQKKQHFRYVDASGYCALSQRIVRYLEEHYAEDISLDTLAAEMEYNKSYLCVAFKKDTQSTILDCLNMIRIRRAAELIVYSDHSLAQVADMCGYASVSHFNRVFLKYVGVTPGQCRRAYPMDALFGSKNYEHSGNGHPTRFMYSVLAQKHITPEMIRDLNALEEKAK